jgi:hypothetical protein
MRKLMIVGLLAAVALGGVAACKTDGDNGTTPSASASAPSGTTTTASAPDETAAVCAQALALEKGNGSTVLAKIQQALAAAAVGNMTSAQQLQGEVVTLGQQWVIAYQELQAKNIKPAVKTAINNFITFIQSIGTDPTVTLASATAKYAELDQALVAACA